LALARGEAERSFTLNIANSLWGQSGFPIEAEYLDTLAVNYGAGLRLVDFNQPDNLERARLAINGWAKEETEGKIRQLFEEGQLQQGTVLVLANAIYFKGEWVEAFSTEDTHDAPFNLLDGSQVTVPMMSRHGMLGYAEGSDFQAVELPYKGDRLRMTILLPAEGRFAEFEQVLDAERVEAILAAMQPTELGLAMPKFTYETSLELSDTLIGMGMTDAFDAGRADFSGIAPNLVISAVVHKAFLAVDEKGTEAAAATGVTVVVTSIGLSMTVDRPFIFLIYDAETGATLFVGRVLNPAG
jgi:serpin B